MLVRTWNLFHGNAHPPERRGFLRQMVELVADGADLVCLQEVPVWALAHLGRWSGLRVVFAIARRPLLPFGARFVTDLNRGLFRSAFEGEAGAILSREHLSEPRLAVVSSGGLRRIVHGARLDDGTFVANFHSHGVDQLERVLEFVAGEPRLILGGDANVRRYDVEGWLPGSIDQILVRGLPVGEPVAWPEERRRYEGRVLSDHAPVELRVG